MAIYWPTPGFKERMFKLCALTKWDFNFCVRSSPLREPCQGETQHFMESQVHVRFTLHDTRPRGLTFTWRCYGFCQRHKSTVPAHSFLFYSCVLFLSYGPFNCISFHKFSRQLSVFSLCSSGLISAVLVLSTICFCMKVSFSPDIIPSGWLGSKHQLIN